MLILSCTKKESVRVIDNVIEPRLEEQMVDVHFETEADILSFTNSIYEEETRNEVGFGTLPIDPTTKVKSLIRLLSGATDYSIERGNVKASYGGVAADKMGIIPGTYIVDFYVLYQKFKVGNGVRVLAPDDARNQKCGIKPGRKEFGCTASQSDRDVTAITLVNHIKNDILGQNVDVWYPRKRADLRWEIECLMP